MNLFTSLALVLVSMTSRVAAFPPAGTTYLQLLEQYPTTNLQLIINNNLRTFYFDTVHTDSWVGSVYCWTSWCLAIDSLPPLIFSLYKGKVSPTHRSNGTIAYIDSTLNSKILGLQMTEFVEFVSSPEPKVSNMSFVEGYEVKNLFLPINDGINIGTMGMGTIYGRQTTLTPFIYEMVAEGLVDKPVFTITYTLGSIAPGAPAFLFLGNASNGDWSSIMGDKVVPRVPMAARDGTWNLMIEDVSLNGTMLGFNGLAIIDTINPRITLPRPVARTLGYLLGANSVTVGDTDRYYYNAPCPDPTTLPTLNLTMETGVLPISPIYYYGHDPLAPPFPCYLNITGQDIFSTGGNPIWSLGIPVINGFVTTFDGAIGAETINFNMTRP